MQEGVVGERGKREEGEEREEREERDKMALKRLSKITEKAPQFGHQIPDRDGQCLSRPRPRSFHIETILSSSFPNLPR